MPEPDRALMDLITADLRTVDWPEPAEIRARGRRRSRRGVTLAAVAVILMLTSVAALATIRPSGGPHPAPAVSPSRPMPLEIPEDALLGQADVVPAVDVQTGESRDRNEFTGDSWLGLCAEQRGLEPLQTTPFHLGRTLLLKQDPDPVDDRTLVLRQYMYRLPSEAAGRLFAWIDQAIAVCQNRANVYPLPRDGGTVMVESRDRWEVISLDGVGDGSMVLRYMPTQPREQKTGRLVGDPPTPENVLLVRVGDLVTQIEPGRSLDNERELRHLARSAAARMCGAANPGC